MNEYFDELINMCKKAYEQNEVPVAALIVMDGKIIGKGINNRIHTNDVTAHAEVIAIKEAEQYLNDWRLIGCDLYVTLEPCNMCKEIIKESRINNVYYLVEKLDYKKGFQKTNFCSIYKEENADIIAKYKKILNSFFESKCNR